MKRNFLTLSVINKRPFNRDIRDSICDEYAIRIMLGNMRLGKGKSNKYIYRVSQKKVGFVFWAHVEGLNGLKSKSGR